MSKKTKNVEIEGLGAVTLSALTVGWLEDHGDVLEDAGSSPRSAARASAVVIHGALRKHHPEITLEQVRDSVGIQEATVLSKDILELSGLVSGGEIPGNQSQATSSET